MSNEVQSLIDGTDEAVTRSMLESIVLELVEYDYANTPLMENAGLFEGTAGMSLFYFEVYRFTSDEKYLERALFYFEKAYSNLPLNNYNLSHGCSGIMWLMNHLLKFGVLPDEYEGYLLRYDEFLHGVIDCYSHNPDPMHGVLSIANYLFARNRSENNDSLKKILQIVDQSKISVQQGILWENSSLDPAIGMLKHINFGYAHGIPAILYFLSKYIRGNIETSLSNELFRAGMSYLNSFYDPDAKSIFPHRIHEERKVYGERLAYCYGDMGLACGFLAIANNLNSEENRHMAVQLGLKTAKYAIDNGHFVTDIGLCHGASGNAYMFLRLYQELKQDIFKKASLLQYQQLLKLRRNGSGIVGFTAVDFNKQTQKFYRRANPGFIEGVAGMGLSIISFLGNGKPCEWDQILFLS